MIKIEIPNIEEDSVFYVPECCLMRKTQTINNKIPMDKIHKYVLHSIDIHKSFNNKNYDNKLHYIVNLRCTETGHILTISDLENRPNLCLFKTEEEATNYINKFK